MSANPNPVLLPVGSSYGTTTISWSAFGHSTVAIHMGSATGTLFTQGGTTGSATTGNWVTNGMVFVLVDASTNATIDSLTVNTATASLSASPNPALIPYGASGGATTISLNAPGDSNVQLHQGSTSGAVVFSGGPTGGVSLNNVANGTTFYLMDVASGNTLQTLTVSASMASLTASPNPIIAPMNGTSGSTTLSYNALSDSNVNLFLGSPSGTKVASGGPTNSVTVTASNGATYYLVDGNTGNTLQELTVSVQNPSLTASPNPIMVSPGVTSGSTTLSFNAPGYTNAQVHMGSASGTVLFTGGPTGSSISSGSVTNGTTIYLVDANSGTTLQTLVLNVTQTPYASSQDFIWLGPQVIAIENGNGH